jgi:hypothetical protein
MSASWENEMDMTSHTGRIHAIQKTAIIICRGNL